MSTPVITASQLSAFDLLLEPAKDKIEIGVEQVRELVRQINLAGEKVVAINPADALTVAAQNALLKTLEEPPEGTQIYLITEKPNVLLPTVLSRCIIDDYQLPTTNYPLADKKVIDWIIAGNIKEGFAWAVGIKDRQEALHQIESLISLKSLKVARKLLKARKYLQANTNVRLTLENLFINLSRPPLDSGFFAL